MKCALPNIDIDQMTLYITFEDLIRQSMNVISKAEENDE